MKNNVQGQVVQRDIKIMKKTMKKSRSRQAETGSNEKIEKQPHQDQE
jgi:hypothetical protein